jgi:hypothetical protein
MRKFQRSHRIFDIVTKNPQIQHVAAKMHHPTMQKHCTDCGRPCWQDNQLWWQDSSAAEM